MAENPIPVCAAADLPPGSVKSFEVGDEIVAVYNIDGTFYATEARCTHGLADLADGTIEGDTIECSFHFGAFHVPSGKAVQSPCFINLKTYKTEVKDGQVLVDLEAPAATASRQRSNGGIVFSSPVSRRSRALRSAVAEN